MAHPTCFMSHGTQSKRWSSIAVGVVLSLLLLVGFSAYAAISQALALCRLRILAARDDAILLRVAALADIEASTASILTRAADRHRAAAWLTERPRSPNAGDIVGIENSHPNRASQPSVTIDSPRSGGSGPPHGQTPEVAWLGIPYVWDGLNLTIDRAAGIPPAEEAPDGSFNQFIEGVLRHVLNRDPATPAAPVAFVVQPFEDRRVVLASMTAHDASLSPFVVAAAIDVDILRTELLDPLFDKSDKVCLMTGPPESGGVWHETMGLAFDPLSIEPSPTFVAAQRRKVTWQVSLYAAVTVVFCAALGIMIRRFLAIIEREVALSQLKSSFAADVSHELKTPLALIRMFSEMLSEKRVPTEEKKQEYYGIITRESARLTHLIENILDFSRIEAGRKAYDFRPVDPEHVVRSTYDIYRLDLDHRGFEHALRIDPDLPLIHADADAVGQAILNLVSNAVKYSRDEKRIDIEVSKETRRGKHGVQIAVKDNGIGIKPEDRAHLFDGFFRAGDDRVRRVRGAGLGLAVVKHIVEAHGGIVDVESRLVKGTTFRIFLPESVEKADTRDRPGPERADHSKGP